MSKSKMFEEYTMKMKHGKATTKIVQQSLWQGFELHKLILHRDDGSEISILLLLPEYQVGPCPCIIAVHGFTSSKDEWIEMDNYTKGGNAVLSLLQNGYAVIALDMYQHGENKDDGLNLTYDELMNEHWEVFFEETMKDIHSAIDYVAWSGKLDPERIGVLTYSVGGVFAFKVANSTAKIKTVAMCVPPVFKEDDDEYAPYNNLDNLSDVPLLMISASRDEEVNFSEAQWLFSQFPDEMEHKRFVSYESGHSLPLEYVSVVVDWFRVYL